MSIQELMDVNLENLQEKTIDELSNLLDEYSRVIHYKSDKYNEVKEHFSKIFNVLLETLAIKRKIRTNLQKQINNKIYYHTHKEERKLKDKEKYNSQEKFVCNICQGRYAYSNKTNHIRTLKHKNALQENKIDLVS
jgi:DNA phosphorothioation-dependent restriction protein DptG